MKTLLINRKFMTPTRKGIIGSLTDLDNGNVLARTYELPWNDNKRSDSCIPAGKYKAKIKYSKRLGRCFEILDVPNRSDILIHVGNDHEDTTGCVLVGKNYNTSSVTQSRLAMGELLLTLPNIFNIVITDIMEA